jgi:Rieske Fe-S protein
MPAACASCGVSRRTFVVQSMFMAAAAALAACGADGATAPNIAAGTQIKVGDYAALSAVGGIALVTLDGSPLAVVRTGASTFAVLSRVCPHQGSIVNQNGSGFLCPNHGARFSADGTWQGGERTSNLRSYPNTYNASTNTITLS